MVVEKKMYVLRMAGQASHLLTVWVDKGERVCVCETGRKQGERPQGASGYRARDGRRRQLCRVEGKS